MYEHEMKCMQQTPKFHHFQRGFIFCQKKEKKMFNFYLQNERRENLPIVEQNHWSEEIE